MLVEDIIYKQFRDEKTIWFDFVDYIKVNYEQKRKGLSYVKNKGRYDIYVENEDGESFFLDSLDNSQGHKLERFIFAFSS